MSGTYPPYDPGQRPGYDNGPEYGGNRGYGGTAGYAEQPGYGGQPGYGPPAHGSQPGGSQYGNEPRYRDEGYETPAPWGPSQIPSQGYPSHDSQPYAAPQPRHGGYEDAPYHGEPAYGGRRDDRAYGSGSGYEDDRYGASQAGGYGPGYGNRYGEAQQYGDYRDAGGVRTADATVYGRAPGTLPVGTATGKPARRGRRTLLIVLSVILVVVAIGGFALWRAAQPYLDQWPATLAKPEKLAGLQLTTEPALQQAANEISAGIRQDVKVDGAIAAFYHDPAAAEKIVALVGGTAFLMSPKAELDEAFRSAQSDGMQITQIQDLDPGELGGLLRCGAAEQKAEGDAKVPLSVCAWADHGSLVIGLFFHRTVDESASLLRTIRGEMLSR